MPKMGRPDARKMLALRIREGRADVLQRLVADRAQRQAHSAVFMEWSWAERLADVVEHVLRNLGDTADEVAYELGKLGIDGLRQDCDECPIARLVYRTFPGLWVAAENDMLKIGDHETEVGITYPPAVEQMIERFDAGAYDELVDVLQMPGPEEEDDDDFDDEEDAEELDEELEEDDDA